MSDWDDIENVGSSEPMCDGKSFGWSHSNSARGREHPAYKPHPRCRKCHRPMGCQRCAGPLNELFCTQCRTWASFQALEFHGEIRVKGDKDAKLKFELKAI